MNKFRRVLLIAAFLCPGGSSFLEAAPITGDGQLGAPLEWIPIPGDSERFYLAQRSQDGRLFLSPNEAFFPKRGLKAAGSGTVKDAGELNGGNTFARIEGWNEGAQAEWGLFFPEKGPVEIAVEAEGGGRFSLSLGKSDARPQKVPSSGALKLSLAGAGRHSLILTCDRGGAGAAVKWIEISGSAVRDAAVIRKRWRPAAAHTKFNSSRSRGNIRLWIMEMDAVPGDLDFYCPITTPFGYYGPTWKADGTVNTSFNFSLWSFGRGQQEPPVEQLSHLIAIGDPEAAFGGFDHEGTGVKIRDWEPLEGRQGQRQALALRVEPGERYDTYYSYFFAADEKRWRLFGAGKKWNKGKPVESLWVGSFVEVPGPPPVQRTGPYERIMRYRGWIMNGKGKWYPLDRMQNGNIDKETGYTHTDRGVTEDGWFFLQTGGWTFRKPPFRGEAVELKTPIGKPPGVDYLDPDDLAFLQKVPSSIEVTRVERRGSEARVSFTLRNPGKKPAVTLFHGPGEGLTFVDRWPNKEEVPEIRDGENQAILRGFDPNAPLYLRLFLKNEAGQFWSAETTVTNP